MYIYNNNLVGSNVEYIWSKKNKQAIIDLDNIIIHYTAGANAISSARYLASDTTPTSAHLVIARDGTIYQIVDFMTQAWHAGKSEFKNRSGLNAYSIGIELDNAGLLKERNNLFYSWFGRQIPQEQVAKHINPQTGHMAYWQTYTDIQLNTLKEICLKLLSYYPIRRILAHSEISLSGKVDPGPAFPLKEFKNLIYH